MSIDSLKPYLDNRLDLIDVSVESKLIIDEVLHPIGVKKNLSIRRKNNY